MIHVMIERHIGEGMVSTYDELSRKALQRTYIVHGFISAEAFVNNNDVHHRFLLCKWRTQQDWNRWAQSPERMELMSRIAPILSTPEKVILLEN